MVIKETGKLTIVVAVVASESCGTPIWIVFRPVLGSRLWVSLRESLRRKWIARVLNRRTTLRVAEARASHGDQELPVRKEWM